MQSVGQICPPPARIGLNISVRYLLIRKYHVEDMNDIRFMVDIISLYELREDEATYQNPVKDYNDIQSMVDIIILCEIREDAVTYKSQGCNGPYLYPIMHYG